MHRALLALIVFSPGVALAGVTISEIMYDLPGSDSGREWVEIVNDGSTAVDITGWKLFENNTNHGIATTSSPGTFSISAGGYAIIADNTEKFLIDWPSFSGVLFDSAFSLSNTGESVSIRNAELIDVDVVAYSAEMGGAGDGNSLERSGNTFVAHVPNPGAGSTASESESGTAASVPESTGAASSGGGTPLSEPRLVANAGVDRAVTVGAAALYEGRVVGELGKPIDNARFIWNFGNGDIREGKSVLYAHLYPGEYVVMLTASSGEISATDRLTVSAFPAAVRVSAVTSEYVEVLNGGERDIDLSFWILRSGDAQFILPKNTVVLARRSVRFANSVTGLPTLQPGSVSLHYPNGVEVLPPPAPAPVSAPTARTELLPAPSGKAPADRKSAPPQVPISSREPVASGTQVASVLGAEVPASANVWVFAFAGLVGVSALAAVVVRRSSRKGSGYTITEVNDGP